MPKFLQGTRVGKQIKSILFNGANIKDSELISFVSGFYNRLVEANESPRTLDRAKGHRRLDAVTRLIVGDETCSAAAFQGDKLLIATNENDHDKYRIIISMSMIIQAATNPNEYALKPVFYISYTGHTDGDDVIPTRVLGQKWTRYKIQDNQLIAISTVANKTSILPSEHLIPYIGELPINANLVLSSRIPLTATDILEMIRYLDVAGEREIETNVESEIAYNRLQTTTTSVVKHMVITYDIATKVSEAHSRITPEKMHIFEEATTKFKEQLYDHRIEIFKQGLTWEAAKLFKEVTPRKYKDSSKSGIDKFIEDITNDFNSFAQSYSTLAPQDLVDTWKTSILPKLDTGTIFRPTYIVDAKRFLEFAGRYFIDIIKLEEYFGTSFLAVENGGMFFDNILSQLNQGVDITELISSQISIVNDLEQGVHAEIRILDKFLEELPKYIATSFLCCPLCKLVMDSSNIENISGMHGRVYPWVFPSKLLCNQSFMESFLGDKLFNIYKILEGKQFVFNHKRGNKAQIAIEIIENIAGVQDELFERSLITKVLSRVGESPQVLLAEESDGEDEELPDALESASPRFVDLSWDEQSTNMALYEAYALAGCDYYSSFS